MASKKIGISGKRVNSQAREVVYNVMQFMQKEANEGVQIPLANYRKRVLDATGVSRGTYQKIVKEGFQQIFSPSISFSSPSKKREKKAPILDNVTPQQIEELKNIIYDFYITDKRRPSLKCILQKIEERQLGLHLQRTTLSTLLQRLGFRSKTTTDNKKALMEKYEIRLARINFLKQIMMYRAEGRNIIYYIHSSYTDSKGWSDGSCARELKSPVAKGKKLFIVHAGGDEGFVPNGLLILQSESKNGDNHNEMNNNNLIKWVETQLLPNIPKNSVLVIDNASYHNVTEEKNITFSSLQIDMIKWLTDHNIDHDDTWTKVELFQKIKEYKPHFPNKIKLDSLLEKHGHEVLRLPPCHPELNPMEKIWMSIKKWVDARNPTFRLSDVETLVRLRISEIEVDEFKAEWKNLCEHVVRYENEQLEREHMLDHNLELLQFTVDTDSSDETESESSDLDKTMPMSDSE